MPPSSQGAADAKTLDGVAVGDTVRVTGVSGEDRIAQRLRDMGFWEDTEVNVVRRAPFGDPTEYALQGYRLALRRSEAARIQVAADEA